MALEEAFGIRIPDHAASAVATAGDLHEVVFAMTGEEWNSWQTIRRIVADWAGVFPEDVSRDLRIADPPAS